MKTRRAVTALGMLLALGMWAVKGQAATGFNPSNLDLKVTFQGAFSVTVDGVQYSSRTFTVSSPNQLVVPSSATVTNDSSGTTEKWQLSVATVSGGGNWAVQGSTNVAPSLDQYALQATFISSAAAAVCPTNVDARWNTINSVVTGVQQGYASTRYADATSQGLGGTGLPDLNSGIQDGDMIAAGFGTPGKGIRGLCVRFYGPGASTSPAEQVVRLTITAVPGT